MPRQIDRDGVRRLADQGAQLVEVLPASEYAKDHLPGASNLPLRKLEQQATAVLNRQRAVVVYCSDSTRDLSPRAAWRLQSMGFTQVYDYSAGKQSPRHPVRRLGLASPGGPDSVLASHAAKLASFGPQCADWPTP